MTGRVMLVGAGPGAADLLTLRAVAALEQATVVLHDRLVGDDILKLVSPAADLIDVGKWPGDDHTQTQIMEVMESMAGAGHQVVRLKGGDPMVFGRGGEELAYLTERGVPVQVIPGITSAVGVPASIGLPLTFRQVASGFTVIAGQTVTPTNAACHAVADTLVILMGAGQRTRIATELVRGGRPSAEPVAFIESGTTPDERVTVATLGDVADGRVDVKPPVVWVCGRVVDTLDVTSIERVAVG